LAGADRKPDYGRIAADYDRLRPVDENWWEVFEALVGPRGVAGRRVLDVGCGTGTLTAALAERGARAWGVDTSEEMLRQARTRRGSGASFRRAAAEELPFKGAWFDRVFFRLVVHNLDRPRAFAEARRVLLPGGQAVIGTFDPARFAEYWLNELFPEIEAIDRARFPDRGSLRAELEGAGFASVDMTSLSQSARLTRDEALERINGRFISTLALLDEDAYEAGRARAERELPDPVEYRIEWLIVSAEREAT
jgi:SAM-dependent methyltransferase